MHSAQYLSSHKWTSWLGCQATTKPRGSCGYPNSNNSLFNSPDTLSRERFIPACAGNASKAALPSCRQSVHPRVCGERISGKPAAVGWRGSSPRVRGTQPKMREQRGRDRFIPACAGNATCGQFEVATDAVHPRVCGERLQRQPWLRSTNGSSPRVRGTPFFTSAIFRRGRFIPACAGNAGGGSAGRIKLPVHPRVCGERSAPAPGSSQAVRFIPACAGNATHASPPCDKFAVHPRVCGERVMRANAELMPYGSSPRVRGTLLLESLDLIVEFQRAGSYRFLGRF